MDIKCICLNDNLSKLHMSRLPPAVQRQQSTSRAPASSPRSAATRGFWGGAPQSNGALMIYLYLQLEIFYRQRN